jgi:hypothetical protein
MVLPGRENAKRDDHCGGLSYSHVTGTPEPCVPLMSSDRIIVDTIKVAQDLLWRNLPPTHNLTDAATVMRFRELRWDFRRTPG